MFWTSFVSSFVLIKFVLAINSNKVHVSITLESSWLKFCPYEQLFKLQLVNLTSIEYSHLIFANVESKCNITSNSKNETVNLSVYIKLKLEEDDFDLQATEKLYNNLKDVKSIGAFKIRLVELKNFKATTFSRETTVMVIGIVLCIYLVGFFLIISMNSDDNTDTFKTRSGSFIISSKNDLFGDSDELKIVKKRSLKNNR